MVTCWNKLVLPYIINRLPSSVLDSKTFMEVLSSFYPDLSTSSNLTPIIFGCMSFVHIYGDGRWKLDPRALKYVFIRYSSTQKGYICYIHNLTNSLSLEMSPSTNKKVTLFKLIFRRRVLVRETSLFYFLILI